MALLLPEPDDGALPVLNPLELPELPEDVEPAEALGLGSPAGLPEWLPDPPCGRETPEEEPTPAVCRAEPGRTSATAPLAAIPLTPTTAVSDRTTDRPRSLAATALATLL